MTINQNAKKQDGAATYADMMGTVADKIGKSVRPVDLSLGSTEIEKEVDGIKYYVCFKYGLDYTDAPKEEDIPWVEITSYVGWRNDKIVCSSGGTHAPDDHKSAMEEAALHLASEILNIEY